MKKIIFTLSIAFLTFAGIQAQDAFKFGVTGGLLNSNTDVNISALGINLANIDAINKTGFYIGAIADIAATEKLHIQPELTYGSAGDLSFIYLPVMAKYYVANGFHIQAGPQFSFSSNLDDIKQTIEDAQVLLGTNSNIDDAVNSLGVDLSFGAGFDVSDNLTIQARYAFALTDWYSGPLGGSLDVKTATLNVGVAYFFN